MEHEPRVNICFQCPRSLYDAFMDLVKEDERSMAWALRKLMQRYVSERIGGTLHG